MTTPGRTVDTPLVLGMMHLCDQKPLREPAALADWIERRLDQGLHWFDHADIYGDGRCETLFGAALAHRPALRDSVRLIGKSGIVRPQEQARGTLGSHYDTSAGHLSAAVDGSLRRLGVERLDLFLIHRPDPLMDPASTARALERLLESGKVARIGVANFLPEQWRLLQQALDAPLGCNQIELSLRASQALFNGTSEALQHDGIQLLARSPLAGGRLDEECLGDRLSEMSAEAGCGAVGLAMAWLRRIPGQPVPVLGSLNEDRIADALRGSGLDMSRQDWFALLEAARGIRVP